MEMVRSIIGKPAVLAACAVICERPMFIIHLVGTSVHRLAVLLPSFLPLSMQLCRVVLLLFHGFSPMVFVCVVISMAFAMCL